MRTKLERLGTRFSEQGLKRTLSWIWGRFTTRPESDKFAPRPATPICESVKQWSGALPDVKCRVLMSATVIHRNLPATVEPIIAEAYSSRTSSNMAERYLARISGAKIVGHNGLVVLPDGKYAAEAIYTKALLQQDSDYAAPPPRKMMKMGGSYFSLLVIWSKDGGYYHWLHDTLQRLYGVIDWLPDDVKYIVPANMRPWQVETLRLMGIRDEQLAYFDANEVWELETLYFAPPTTNSGSSRRDAEEWLRDRILAAYQIQLRPGHRRIFISRRHIWQRRLANEDAVVALLQNYGFETCTPETLSFRDQVALFAEAEIVVSTHGSALANILFAPPGLVLVDMVDTTMKSWGYVFWTMCEALGHHYWYFSTDSVERAGSQPDALVQVEKLEATLESIGVSRVVQSSPTGGIL